MIADYEQEYKNKKDKLNEIKSKEKDLKLKMKSKSIGNYPKESHIKFEKRINILNQSKTKVLKYKDMIINKIEVQEENEVQLNK